jgi:hypothetical protein
VTLGPDLQHLLVQRFTDSVMRLAKVPPARRPDVEDGPRFSAGEGEIRCTCGITGSTYVEPWDGTAHAAEGFADYVGEMTADLVKRKKKHHHYAWLYATR